MASPRPVAEFPLQDKKIRRSIPNPLDKATIVSIVPAPIDEPKYTIYPGRFVLEAGSVEKPAVLTVGPSYWYYQAPNDGPMMEITHSSNEMAASIIKDYCNGMLGCDMDSRRPGLFFIPGEISQMKVVNAYTLELKEAEAKQKAWFAELVKLADSLWARANGNPLVIWDMMRIAARTLGFEDKEWVKDHIAMEKVRCVGCGGLKEAAYPVCPTCRVIDKNHPLAKELTFAR